MKNNKGFISMSLVYSFLIVFVTISAALLTVYTENISDIRKLNTEIKDDLIERGNDQIIVLENLVTNGSFENTGSGVSASWYASNTNCSFSSKSVVTDPDGTNPKQTGQAYYGDGSIEINTELGNCFFASTSRIRLEKDHVYYVEITYNSGNGFDENATKLYFKKNNYNSSPSSTDYVNTSITPSLSSEKPFMTPWTMPSGSGSTFVMGSVNADIFRFKRDSGEYYIGLFFSSRKSQPTYMDGFMLIDITAAIGTNKADDLCNDDTHVENASDPYSACEKTAANSAKIWRLKSGKVITSSGTVQYTTEGFYDGRKVFSAHDADSIK